VRKGERVLHRGGKPVHHRIEVERTRIKEASVDIQVERGAADSYAGGLLLLFSFDSPEDWEEPVRKVDLKWGGFLSTLMKQGDFKGELFESRSFTRTVVCRSNGCCSRAWARKRSLTWKNGAELLQKPGR